MSFQDDISDVRDAYVEALSILEKVEPQTLRLPIGHKATLLNNYAQQLAFVAALSDDIDKREGAH